MNNINEQGEKIKYKNLQILIVASDGTVIQLDEMEIQ